MPVFAFQFVGNVVAIQIRCFVEGQRNTRQDFRVLFSEDPRVRAIERDGAVEGVPDVLEKLQVLPLRLAHRLEPRQGLLEVDVSAQ